MEVSRVRMDVESRIGKPHERQETNWLPRVRR